MEAAEVITRPCATFWHSPGRGGWGKGWNAKWASSAAHVSGARVVTAEAYPAAPRNNESAWVNYPWNFKQRADNMMCAGVSRCKARAAAPERIESARHRRCSVPIPASGRGRRLYDR